MSEEYTCEECGKSFDSERGLHIHIGEAHPDKKSELLEKSKSKKEEAIRESEEPTKDQTNSHAKIMAVIALVGILVIVGLLTYSNDLNKKPSTAGRINNITSNTSDIVATVDGELIKESAVESMKQQFTLMRQNVSKEIIIEQLISQEILTQQAEKEGYSVSRKEVEERIESQVTGSNMTMEDLKQQVENSGGSWEEQIEKYREQLAMQNYISEAIAGEVSVVTEEDIKNYYESYKNRTQQKLPPLGQVKQQVNTTLQQRERQKAIDSLVQKLRPEYNIKYK